MPLSATDSKTNKIDHETFFFFLVKISQSTGIDFRAADQAKQSYSAAVGVEGRGDRSTSGTLTAVGVQPFKGCTAAVRKPKIRL